MTEKPVKIVDSQAPSLKTEVQCSCHSDQPLQEGEPHERSYLKLGIKDLLFVVMEEVFIVLIALQCMLVGINL